MGESPHIPLETLVRCAQEGLALGQPVGMGGCIPAGAQIGMDVGMRSGRRLEMEIRIERKWV